MDYSFNTDVAVEVGVEAAVIFQNISFWCRKNAANEMANPASNRHFLPCSRAGLYVFFDSNIIK
jgi:hypothetical protein